VATKRSLLLFHKAAEQIPAYADFLKDRGLNPEQIKTIRDLKKIPTISKKNYLQKYPLQKLVWQDSLDKPLIFCSTSGSTGVPYYFPRDEKLSWQYSWLIEDFLNNGSGVKREPVLVILAFGMGVWIGGIITLRALEIALQRTGYPVSLLPTGYNKSEVIKALRQLSPQFSQTILIGYPPFIKEIIDEADREQINLIKFNTRLIFAAEAFSETFRDYVSKKTEPIRFWTL
jgi:phenylacetate-CoA ligase